MRQCRARENAKEMTDPCRRVKDRCCGREVAIDGAAVEYEHTVTLHHCELWNDNKYTRESQNMFTMTFQNFPTRSISTSASMWLIRAWETLLAGLSIVMSVYPPLASKPNSTLHEWSSSIKILQSEREEGQRDRRPQAPVLNFPFPIKTI